MFKVSIKDKSIFAKIEKSIIRDIELILGTKEMLDEVGGFVADRVRYQARVSRPLNRDSSLPDLKPSTIRNREYLSRYNETHQTFEPPRSNLTITGQLLDSIKHKITGVGEVTVDVSGTHRGYVSGTGRRGKSISNEKLKGYLDQKGFVIFDESIDTNRTIVSRIKTIVLRYIRRGLAVRNKLAKQ